MEWKRIKLIVGLLLVLMVAVSVQADVISIANHSFESDVLTEGGFIIPASVWNGGVAYYPPNDQILSSTVDGHNVLALTSTASEVYQSLGVNYISGATYTLTVACGKRTGHLGIASNVFGLFYADDHTEVESMTVNISNTDAGNGKMTYYYIEYVATAADAGREIAVGMKRGLDSTSGVQAIFDNVSLDVTVPEPATAVLLGLGCGWALIRRRK